MAVVSRLSTAPWRPQSGRCPTTKETTGGKRSSTSADRHYGVDIWYCERARGGNRPAVTAVCLGYPVYPGTDGMRMSLLEYSGADGFELCDQISQSNIRGTSASTTTTFGLRQDDELAITAIVGDMSSATPPLGWTTRVADTAQRCYVADTLSTGGASAALQAKWTGLAGASEEPQSPPHSSRGGEQHRLNEV